MASDPKNDSRQIEVGPLPLPGIEVQLIDRWLEECSDEVPVSKWHLDHSGPRILCIPMGFEERATAILESFAARGTKLDAVLLGKYPKNVSTSPSPAIRPSSNVFRRLAGRCACPRKGITQVPNADDGAWVGLRALPRNAWVGVDITGLSARGLFGVLDRLTSQDLTVTLFYTEADQYWPTRAAWNTLRRRSLAKHVALSVQADTERWLYGSEHRVELIPHHEGYGASGSAALVAFLPFKASRLAAVMSGEDYSEYVFIAGVPRLSENRWRLDASKIINEPLIGSWGVEEIETFGYKGTVKALTSMLLGSQALLERTDVHLAVLGSKLQTIGCWIVSTVVPGITVVTSTPERYFTKAFSAGRGESWAIDLAAPPTLRPLTEVPLTSPTTPTET